MTLLQMTVVEFILKSYGVSKSSHLHIIMNGCIQMATQKLSIKMEGIPRNTGNTNSAKHWH